MSEIITLSSGETIELCRSGNGNPPDQQTGQHTNVSTVWVRLPGGHWRYVDGVRSHWRAKVEAEAFDVASDAMEWLCGPTEPSPDELRQQAISFACGNVHMHNPAVTREGVEQAADEIQPINVSPERQSEIEANIRRELGDYNLVDDY